MASPLVDAVGASGAVLTTVCWVPQAVKIIRDRDTRAISLPGTMLCVIGVLFWLIYGVAIVDGPLIGSSVITFAITASHSGAQDPARLKLDFRDAVKAAMVPAWFPAVASVRSIVPSSKILLPPTARWRGSACSMRSGMSVCAIRAIRIAM